MGKRRGTCADCLDFVRNSREKYIVLTATRNDCRNRRDAAPRRAHSSGISAGDLAGINLVSFLDSARYVEVHGGINFKVRRC